LRGRPSRFRDRLISFCLTIHPNESDKKLRQVRRILAVSLLQRMNCPHAGPY
jgi:hypothetical protein